MDASPEPYEDLIRSAARRLKGHRRRLFQAEVATALCGGNPRAAERRFGWGRDAVATGLNEARQGLRCVEHFAAKGAPPSEQKDPQLAADARAIVEPHARADPQLKSPRRRANLSAAEVVQALKGRYGYTDDRLPSERTLRDFTQSRETSDFWVDALQVRWLSVQGGLGQVKRLVVYLDNGPKNSGTRAPWLRRMVEFCDWSGLEVRLVYYPP